MGDEHDEWSECIYAGSGEILSRIVLIVPYCATSLTAYRAMSTVTSEEVAIDIIIENNDALAVAEPVSTAAAIDTAIPVARRVITADDDSQKALGEINNLLSQIESRNVLAQAQVQAQVESSGSLLRKITKFVAESGAATMCFLYCFLFLFVMGLIGSGIALTVFDIIGLSRTSNEQLHSECKDSNLFAFIIVVLIFPCVQSCCGADNDKKGGNRIVLLYC